MARISKEQREKIKSDIIETSRQLFIEEGYSQTSTKKIAKRVGIAEGTVFNYFKTKSDILIEVITGDMSAELFDGPETINDVNVEDIYIKYYQKVCKPILKLPKKIMLDVFLAIFKASKTAPNMIKHFASIDFKFIDVLEDMSKELQAKNLIKACDARLLAESLYSDVMFGFVIYSYDQDMALDACFEMINQKFSFTLAPLIIKEV